MKKFASFSLPNFPLLTIFFKNPIALAGVVPVVALVPVVKLYDVCWLLFWLFLIDLVTGILASYFLWKKKALKGKFFFGQKQGYSSDKFKKCLVKGIVYAGFPLIILEFQQVFMIKNISFKMLTDAQIDLTTVFLLFFCANETFSIFWENLPICGLDIPNGLKNLFLGVKKITKEPSDE